MRISWAKSKRRLALLWFVGAGVLFFILLIQSILGRYGDNVDKAWQWFLPTTLPTLSLVIGVLVADALGKGKKIRTVDRFFFKLSFTLSLIYLLTIFTTIVLQPFSTLTTVELMSQSNLWLAPLQGLVAASLGAFFVQRDEE